MLVSELLFALSKVKSIQKKKLLSRKVYFVCLCLCVCMSSSFSHVMFALELRQGGRAPKKEEKWAIPRHDFP